MNYKVWTGEMAQQFICLTSKCEDLQIPGQHWVDTAAPIMLPKAPVDPCQGCVGMAAPVVPHKA